MVIKAFIQHFLLLTSNIFWRMLGASILNVLSKNSKFLSKLFDEKKMAFALSDRQA